MPCDLLFFWSSLLQLVIYLVFVKVLQLESWNKPSIIDHRALEPVIHHPRGACSP